MIKFMYGRMINFRRLIRGVGLSALLVPCVVAMCASAHGNQTPPNDLLPNQGQYWSECKDLSDPAKVIASCSDIITTDKQTTSNVVEALSYRGLAYLQIGDRERAWQDLDRSIQLNPTLSRPFVMRGIAFSRS